MSSATSQHRLTGNPDLDNPAIGDQSINRLSDIKPGAALTPVPGG
jgi:hypothetical protein